MKSVTKVPSRQVSEDPRGSAPQLLQIIKGLPDVIFSCEKRADGKIYWTFNEGRLAEEFHLTTDEIKGRSLEEMFPPPVVATLLPEFERAFAGEAHEFTNELGGRYFKHFPQPVFGPDGRVTAVIGFISEVTMLVKAEQQIAKLNRELAQRVDELAVANQELEAFSYSVSHDLRTPLTAIDNHTQVLLERDGDRLGEKGRHSLERVRTSVGSMNQLIDDILRLSRSTTMVLEKDKVDVGALARVIAMELQEAQPERRVEWTIPDGMNAFADPRLMRVLLQNLMGNAWKYTSQQPKARIELGIVASENGPACYVRDNGVGFDPKHSGQLFQAFHRLPSAASFRGTGIGLATVKRIVDRHGGKVWGTGESGKGATFFFALPGAP